MASHLEKYSESVFERIKRLNEIGQEYWSARELYQALDYTNPSLVGFIEELLVPYLYSYSYFEKTSRMPFGELSHGGKGITEYYQQLLQLDSEVAVIGFLRVLADDDYRGHHHCPCSNGKNLRACHGQQLREIMAYQSSDEFALEYLNVAKYLEDSGSRMPKLYVSKSLMKKHEKSRSLR